MAAVPARVSVRLCCRSRKTSTRPVRDPSQSTTVHRPRWWWLRSCKSSRCWCCRSADCAPSYRRSSWSGHPRRQSSSRVMALAPAKVRANLRRTAARRSSPHPAQDRGRQRTTPSSSPSSAQWSSRPSHTTHGRSGTSGCLSREAGPAGTPEEMGSTWRRWWRHRPFGRCCLRARWWCWPWRWRSSAGLPFQLRSMRCSRLHCHRRPPGWCRRQPPATCAMCAVRWHAQASKDMQLRHGALIRR